VEVGLVAVLHTWGQQLSHHPHLHCVVTGGGLACTTAGQTLTPPRWQACRPGFFLPVRVLSRLFRGKFVAGLRAAATAGRLGCHGRLAALAEGPAFVAWLTALAEREWVVYSKPPFAGPEVVLKYLARYTHRICVSNHRLVSLTEEGVTFRYKDYADAHRQKTLTVSAAEFIRRFLQHVLPRGFVRVRHYGLLANRYREAKLAVCRRLLGVSLVVAMVLVRPPREAEPCPRCGGTTWAVVERVARPSVAEVCRRPLGADTS
jgi:hypothetical protein